MARHRRDVVAEQRVLWLYVPARRVKAFMSRRVPSFAAELELSAGSDHE